MPRVRWEDRLLALFDDLEQQAEGLALADRDVEVAELSRAEYAGVDLASRLHASVGAAVTVRVQGLDRLDGVIERVGSDVLLLDARPHQWLVRVAALTGAAGLSGRARAESARAVTARLGLGSALRELVRGGLPVLVCRVDGSRAKGLPRRVGADFLELTATGDALGPTELVPFSAICAVRPSS